MTVLALKIIGCAVFILILLSLSVLCAQLAMWAGEWAWGEWCEYFF